MGDEELPRCVSSISLWDKYKEMSRIMSILCNNVGSYYNFWKQLLQVPLIITSSAMAILNSNIESKEMKIINIAFNALTAVLISLNNQLKFNEKASQFFTLGMKFSKLEHSIETAINLNDMNNEKLNTFIIAYDNLMENTDNIPDYVKKQMKKKISNYIYIPYILNGDSHHNSNANIVMNDA